MIKRGKDEELETIDNLNPNHEYTDVKILVYQSTENLQTYFYLITIRVFFVFR